MMITKQNTKISFINCVNLYVYLIQTNTQAQITHQILK